ncbi:MAG: beta-lactamase family protein [Clostridiales bacterium]|nr:beta-lactamase family protein [Clostridiales bacterium]
MEYEKLDELLQYLTESRIIPAISVAVGKQGEIVFSRAYGSVFETGTAITCETRFDIASMTKILTGICFMRLVEQGYIGLYDPICNFFPELNAQRPIERNGETIGWCDASEVTWFHALTHTTGMGWTRPKTRPSLPNLGRGLQDIFDLPFAYVPGSRVLYSDLPIILMGVAMERVTGQPLDRLVEESLCEPLGLRHTGYRRISRCLPDWGETAPTEYDAVFRKRRIWGEVHDENASLLDGVAAHAGVFSTANDMCELMMRYAASDGKDGLLKKTTVQQMAAEQAEEDGDRRGLIWKLSSPREGAYTKSLSPGAYGHEGFTGCLGWNDPDKGLTVVLLSNDVYYGREARRLPQYRQQIMRAAVDGI